MLGPWITWILLTPAAGAPVHLQVINDHSAGVKSVISKINAHNLELQLGPTDEDGRIDLEQCLRGERVRAKPDSSSYYQGELSCPLVVPKTAFKVTGVAIAANLLRQAQQAEESGFPAVAALLYNDLAVRARAYDGHLATTWAQKAYRSFAEFTATPEPLTKDTLQDQLVMSEEFAASVRSFQQKEGLPRTGVIDYQTLEKAAGQPISNYLFSPPRAAK